jgi:hypothetical protein
LDLLTVECKDKKSQLGQEVQYARATLQTWESAYTRQVNQLNEVGEKIRIISRELLTMIENIWQHRITILRYLMPILRPPQLALLRKHSKPGIPSPPQVSRTLTLKEADIETYKIQTNTYRGLCDRNQKRSELALQLLEKDLPLAKDLEKDSVTKCLGSTLKLLECKIQSQLLVLQNSTTKLYC